MSMLRCLRGNILASPRHLRWHRLDPTTCWRLGLCEKQISVTPSKVMPSDASSYPTWEAVEELFFGAQFEIMLRVVSVLGGQWGDFCFGNRRDNKALTQFRLERPLSWRCRAIRWLCARNGLFCVNIIYVRRRSQEIRWRINIVCSAFAVDFREFSRVPSQSILIIFPRCEFVCC